MIILNEKLMECLKMTNLNNNLYSQPCFFRYLICILTNNVLKEKKIFNFFQNNLFSNNILRIFNEYFKNFFFEEKTMFSPALIDVFFICQIGIFSCKKFCKKFISSGFLKLNIIELLKKFCYEENLFEMYLHEKSNLYFHPKISLFSQYLFGLGSCLRQTEQTKRLLIKIQFKNDLYDIMFFLCKNQMEILTIETIFICLYIFLKIDKNFLLSMINKISPDEKVHFFDIIQNSRIFQSEIYIFIKDYFLIWKNTLNGKLGHFIDKRFFYHFLTFLKLEDNDDILYLALDCIFSLSFLDKNGEILKKNKIFNQLKKIIRKKHKKSRRLLENFIWQIKGQKELSINNYVNPDKLIVLSHEKDSQRIKELKTILISEEHLNFEFFDSKGKKKI